MFSTPSNTETIILATLNLSYAHAFNSVKVKVVWQRVKSEKLNVYWTGGRSWFNTNYKCWWFSSRDPWNLLGILGAYKANSKLMFSVYSRCSNHTLYMGHNIPSIRMIIITFNNHNIVNLPNLKVINPFPNRPAWVAQWWACRTHDLVVVSSIPGWGNFSFWRIFASHLCRSMWEK